MLGEAFCGLILLSIGCLGILVMCGALLPVALLFRKSGALFPRNLDHSLLVLIPAHNEADSISLTIASIKRAADFAKIKIRILVGADSCTDNTATLAKAAGAEVFLLDNCNKWQNLLSFSKLPAPEEWIALVDAGTIWPESLLSELISRLQNPSYLGIAPTYSPEASFLEKILWRVEAFSKDIENHINGPVSSHGACVFYRREVLHACLESLQNCAVQNWLNDDVVIPMMAHILYPTATFNYWRPKKGMPGISDIGLKENQAQFVRRRRMVVGNLQWIFLLLPRLFRNSPACGILALRRVFRLFWVYWPLCISFGISLLCFPVKLAWMIPPIAGIVAVAALFALGKRSLIGAAFASLLAPIWSTAVRRKHHWN